MISNEYSGQESVSKMIDKNSNLLVKDQMANNTAVDSLFIVPLLSICNRAYKFSGAIGHLVRDELVDISNPLALFEQSVFSTGYGTLDP